ncbi:penicillin acylase family protein [Nocardioides daphniae]|uniref:Penicillin acylase family protein n=1 Tax=Nocardioides daphniae TaxID=402297 RepID=A0A4P7UD03_9ACTN|nr:penicillin acylase family protein [Nocardioides daphniae]QCC78122.1 penicillin acylase family protein [Nocardioides daphniae]GGD21767.1 penicillin amidase [Nocardioides daphniae]
MSTQTGPVTDAAPAAPATPAPGSWWERYRSWPTWAHVTTGLVIALVLLLVALAVHATNVYRRPLPQTTGEAQLPGLGAAVEVLRDANGVPQLYADTDRDLIRAQGYVHAQERFFEMDVRRHATAGRLAELFGREALDSDKMVRTMGWRRVADEELGLVSTDTRALLDAYADGVNAYLAQHDPDEIAVEYSLLGLTGLDHVPAKWTATDSLAWLKAMAWDLRGNMDDEIDRAVAALDNDPSVVADLHPPYDARRHLSIVPEAASVSGRVDEVADELADDLADGGSSPAAAVAALDAARAAADAVPALLGRGDSLGSNSWVVAGSRTATGKPLLANDPHLGTSQPGIWTQMGLHCREVTPDCTLDVAGFTFSGFPGVVIGHNAEIAWGFTNLGPDVTDLYLERVRGDVWWQDGRARRLEDRTETIRVRGEEDFVLRVRSTDHGPLISDVFQDASSVGANAAREAGEPDPYAVALRWTALDPGTTADAVFALNRAGDWTSFRAAAALFDVPSQNLVYADRAGNIGYQAPGRIPVRRPGHDGRTPAAGWRKANDWTGRHIPFEALPSVLNPAEGFIVTANQAVTGPDYPYFLTDDWDEGYRAQRIRELLADDTEVSVGDMARIQLDAANPMADALVPALTAIDDLSPYVQEAVDLLAEWDGQDRADSAAAAYFHVVWERLLALTFHDDLRERIHPNGGARWVSVVERLLTQPRHALWDDRDTEETEQRDDVLRRALVEARDEMTARRSRNPDRWAWGHLHELELTHQTLGTSGIGLVERIFNRNGGGVDGSHAAPNATAYDATEGFTVTSSPSMRMVVDLADFDDSRWVNLTGVSGHPASSHYDDQVELFVEGRTLPWHFSRDAVRRASEDRLLLAPTDD